MRPHIIYKVAAAMLLGLPLLMASCQRETKDEKIRRDFEEFTAKECPKDIDEYTSLDSAYYNIENRTLSYYYSVRDLLDNEVFYTEDLEHTFSSNVLKELKSSIQMKGYKEEGITFRYVYTSSSTKKQLLELTFTKEDY